MSKSIYGKEHLALAEALRSARTSAGLTQAEVAASLDRAQSFVSDVENGHRRLDLAQLADYCRAVGVPLVTLVSRWQRAQKP